MAESKVWIQNVHTMHVLWSIKACGFNPHAKVIIYTVTPVSK